MWDMQSAHRLVLQKADGQEYRSPSRRATSRCHFRQRLRAGTMHKQTNERMPPDERPA